MTASIHLLAVVEENDEVVRADLFQAVRAAGACQHGRAWTDVEAPAVHGHRAPAAQNVIDFVFFLLVIADGRSRLERALGEDEPELRDVREERVPDGLSAAVVRAGLRFL